MKWIYLLFVGLSIVVAESSEIEKKNKVNVMGSLHLPKNFCKLDIEKINKSNIEKLIAHDQTLFKKFSIKFFNNPKIIEQVRIHNRGLANLSAIKLLSYDKVKNRKETIEESFVSQLKALRSELRSPLYRKFLNNLRDNTDAFDGYYAKYLYGAKLNTPADLYFLKSAHCEIKTKEPLSNYLYLKETPYTFLKEYVSLNKRNCSDSNVDISNVKFYPNISGPSNLYIRSEYEGCIPEEVISFPNIDGSKTILVLHNLTSTQWIKFYQQKNGKWKSIADGRNAKLFPKQIATDEFINRSYKNAGLEDLDYSANKNGMLPYLYTFGGNGNLIATHKGVTLFTLKFEDDQFQLGE